MGNFKGLSILSESLSDQGVGERLKAMSITEAMDKVIYEAPHHLAYVVLGLQGVGEVWIQEKGWDSYPNLWKWFSQEVTLEDIFMAVEDVQKVLESTLLPTYDIRDPGPWENAYQTFLCYQGFREGVLRTTSKRGVLETLTGSPQWQTFSDTYFMVEEKLKGDPLVFNHSL